uniref:Uncharacterized protein n=1 Tax=Aegilops tauschii subsp. strangulata TaxID=200361 RepID=A0A452ZTM5_AEGTS
MTQSSSSTSDTSDDDSTGIIFRDLTAEQSDEEFDQRFAATMDSQIEAQLFGTGRCRRSGRRRRRSGGKRRYLDRNREAGNELLVADYFSANPVYTDAQFRRRYRMRKPLFHRIVQALQDWSPEFRHRRDALNRSGFTPLQKCT